MAERGYNIIHYTGQWWFLVLVCLLWAPAIATVPANPLFPSNILAEKLLYSVIVLGSGLLLNLLCKRHRMLGMRTFMPVFFLIFISLSLSDFKPDIVSALANVFLLLAIASLVESYHSKNLAYIIFFAGLFVSISVLLSPKLLFTILAIPAGLLLFRAFNWREWAFGVTGFIIPIYVALCLTYIINGNLEVFDIFPEAIIPSLFTNKNLFSIDYFLYGWLAFIFIISGFHIPFLIRNKALWRRAYPFILICILLFLAAWWLYPSFLVAEALAIPLSVWLSLFFLNTRMQKTATIILSVGIILFAIRFLYYAIYII